MRQHSIALHNVFRSGCCCCFRCFCCWLKQSWILPQQMLNVLTKKKWKISMTEFDMPCEITQSYWIRCKEHVQLCACKAQSPVSLSTSQLRRGKWWKSSFCVSLFKLQLIFMHVFSMVRPISLPLIFCVQAEDNNNEKSDGRFQLLGWKTCTVPTSSTNWNWKSKIRICMAAAGETSGLSPVSLTFAHLCEHGAFNFVFTVVVFFSSELW